MKKLCIILFLLILPALLTGEDVILFLNSIDPEASIFSKESILTFDHFGNDQWICSIIGKLNQIISNHPYLRQAYRIRNYFVQAMVQNAISQGEKVYWSKIGLKYVNQARKRFPEDNVFKFWSLLFYSEANFYLNSRIFTTLAPRIIAFTERIVKKDPLCCKGIPLLFLGSLYLKLPSFPISVGDKKKSEAYLKKCIHFFPQLNLAHLRLAELYYSEGKIDKALKEIERARKVEPGNFIEYYDYLLYRDGIDKFEYAIRTGMWKDSMDLMLMLRKWSLERNR